MSLYDAAKDALKIAQQVDNVDLVQKLLDVQKMALDMQEKQQELSIKISAQQKEIAQLKDGKKFYFAEGHDYMVEEDQPDRFLCPVCTRKNGFAVPLERGNNWCSPCNRQYE